MISSKNTTAWQYLAYRILTAGLEALYTLLIFIVSMQLNATPLQLTLLACAKPVVSLFAFQSTSVVIGKPQRNRFFLWGTSLLASLPCLAFPWVNSVWFYIGAYALFMTTLRASLPVWIEILKTQSKGNPLSATAAKGSAINYFMLIFIPVIIGPWMDYHPEIWRGLFCA